jgi:uncharacterized protein involved in type VI secretion and phage assembly
MLMATKKSRSQKITQPDYPPINGVAVALVTANRDPDGLCRVKVRYPWHVAPTKSFWARLAVPMAGRDRGVVFLPESGDEVLVAFERGDLRFPYVVGALWNGQDRPPETNSDGKNDRRIIKSRKGHKLVFDDGATGRVELILSSGKKLAIDDNDIRLDDGKGNRIVIQSNANSVSIAAAGHLRLVAQTISIEASGTLTARGAMVNIN